MKKALLLLLPFTAAALTTHAQKMDYGIKGGLNLSNDITRFERYFPSFYAGGFAELKFSKHWGVQSELLYSQSGEYYTDHKGSFSKDKHNYLNIPVMLKYYIIPNLYLEVGPELNILLQAKEETDRDRRDLTQYYRRTNLSAGAGIGYKLPWGLGISTRYMFGVSNKSQSGSYYTSNLQVGANYTFHRKK
ncbi:porin family protein [Chitinophaga sp. RAB17]|uniref:porin family protein n=1 Tax=Chitinophaga sp. RAB17 TaxID=3233049 RepID=UPI003F8DE0AA